MKKADVVEFFGGVKATADALGIASPAVSQWNEDVPKPRRKHVELAMRYERERREAEAKTMAEAQ